MVTKLNLNVDFIKKSNSLRYSLEYDTTINDFRNQFIACLNENNQDNSKIIDLLNDLIEDYFY